MKLLIKRFKYTEEVTLGYLIDEDYPKLFRFLIAEPPVPGLSKTPLSTLMPGEYKMYAKTNMYLNKISLRTQKVRNKPFFVLTHVDKECKVEEVEFVSRALGKFEILFLIGKPKGTDICPDDESYKKFVTRLFIATKNKESITLKIE